MRIINVECLLENNVLKSLFGDNVTDVVTKVPSGHEMVRIERYSSVVWLGPGRIITFS